MELLLNKLDALVIRLEKAGGKVSQASNDIRAQLNNIQKLDGLASVVDSAGASDLSGSVASF